MPPTEYSLEAVQSSRRSRLSVVLELIIEPRYRILVEVPFHITMAAYGVAASSDSISPSHVYILILPSYGDLLIDVALLTKSNSCQRLRQPSEQTP
jgi:hypothetical protein